MPYQSDLTYLLVALPSNQTYIHAHREVVERVRRLVGTPKHRVTRPHVTIKEWTRVTHVSMLMTCIEQNLEQLHAFKLRRTSVRHFPEKNAIYVGFESRAPYDCAFTPLWPKLNNICLDYTKRETKELGPTPHMSIIFDKDYTPDQFDDLWKEAQAYPILGPEGLWFSQLALFCKSADGETSRLATYHLK